jgi:signal transduction histidine kinase
VRFSIFQKFLLIIVILGGTSLTVGFLSLASLYSFKQSLIDTVEDSAKCRFLAAQIREDLLNIIRSEENLVLSQDIEHRDKYILHIQQMSTELEETLNRLVIIAKDDLSDINLFINTWDQWKATNRHVIYLVQQELYEDARTLSQETGERLAEESRLVLSSLINKYTTEMEYALIVSNQQYSRILYIILLIKISGILLGILISVLIARNIRYSVTSLIRQVKQIQSTQDLTHTIQVDTTDEIGELAKAFDQMRETLLQSRKELLRVQDELEERVRERTQELTHRNKELDQFAYVASHDLKAPLRAIDNLSTWIMEDAMDTLPEPSKRHLRQMRNRVERMENLLDDLLIYSRVGRKDGDLQEIDSHLLVEQVIENIAPPETFRIDVQPDMPTLYTARTPLEVVFSNLIGNAVKHHNRNDGQIWIRAQESGKWIEFSVSDDGPGIAPHFHERIFEMFQTLRPRDEVEGSGMGLAIVKKHVENRHGTLTVESEPGKGTTFRFTWPKHEKETERQIYESR